MQINIKDIQKEEDCLVFKLLNLKILKTEKIDKQIQYNTKRSIALHRFYNYHWERTDVVKKFYDYHWNNPIKIA